MGMLYLAKIYSYTIIAQKAVFYIDRCRMYILSKSLVSYDAI